MVKLGYFINMAKIDQLQITLKKILKDSIFIFFLNMIEPLSINNKKRFSINGRTKLLRKKIQNQKLERTNMSRSVQTAK